MPEPEGSKNDAESAGRADAHGPGLSGNAAAPSNWKLRSLHSLSAHKRATVRDKCRDAAPPEGGESRSERAASGRKTPRCLEGGCCARRTRLAPRTAEASPRQPSERITKATLSSR